MCDVRAKVWRPVRALIRDDLPTLERPAKAISGGPIGGKRLQTRDLRVNFSERSSVIEPLQLAFGVVVERPELMALQPIGLEPRRNRLSFLRYQVHPCVAVLGQLIGVTRPEHIGRTAPAPRLRPPVLKPGAGKIARGRPITSDPSEIIERATVAPSN